MPDAKRTWTVFAVYDDNEQRYSTFIDAPTVAEAERLAKVGADGPIIIAGVVAGRVHSVDATPENVTPIRGAGHAIEVSSVIVSSQPVIIPGRCPHCKADTRRAHALTETNLQYQDWKAHLGRDGKKLSHERDHTMTVGAMVPTVALRCTVCQHAIWDGVYGP